MPNFIPVRNQIFNLLLVVGNFYLKMALKEGKYVQKNPLKCCQSSDSLTSISTTGDLKLCEALNNFVITPTLNKMTVFSHNNLQKPATFPKRPPIDLTFEKISFTATKWNFRKFKLGTYIFTFFCFLGVLICLNHNILNLKSIFLQFYKRTKPFLLIF